jgi:arsenate reductase (thioredoxin)
VDEKDAAAPPPAEPTPPAEPAAAAPAPAEPAEEPLVQHPGTIPTTAPAAPLPKRRFPKFDKLWESMKRWGSNDESSGVIPAGPVNRTRHRAPRVFFVDTGNVSASQFAEALAIQEGLHAESGGTFPAGDIPPEALAAMDEKGIDLRGSRPKLIDPSRLHSFDRVVLLGGMFPPAWREGARVEEWEVLNPAGLPLEGYRLVRDDVEKRVKRLAKLLLGKQAAQDAAARKMLKAR